MNTDPSTMETQIGYLFITQKLWKKDFNLNDEITQSDETEQTLRNLVRV